MHETFSPTAKEVIKSFCLLNILYYTLCSFCVQRHNQELIIILSVYIQLSTAACTCTINNRLVQSTMCNHCVVVVIKLMML